MKFELAQNIIRFGLKFNLKIFFQTENRKKKKKKKKEEEEEVKNH